jgi:hypothetical protein
MKSITFSELNRSGDVLHIEVPGAIVNIRVNLTDRLGRSITRVDISPMDNSRSPDAGNRYWRLADDGVRIIQDILHPALTGNPDTLARKCRHCAADIEQGLDGLWADFTDVWTTGQADPDRDETDRLICRKAPLRDYVYPGLHAPEPELEPLPLSEPSAGSMHDHPHGDEHGTRTHHGHAGGHVPHAHPDGRWQELWRPGTDGSRHVHNYRGAVTVHDHDGGDVMHAHPADE